MLEIYYLKGMSIICYALKRQRIENCSIVINKSHYLWYSNSLGINMHLNVFSVFSHFGHTQK